VDIVIWVLLDRSFEKFVISRASKRVICPYFWLMFSHQTHTQLVKPWERRGCPGCTIHPTVPGTTLRFSLRFHHHLINLALLTSPPTTSVQYMCARSFFSFLGSLFSSHLPFLATSLLRLVRRKMIIHTNTTSPTTLSPVTRLSNWPVSRQKTIDCTVC
jgi:hypothetical protein